MTRRYLGEKTMEVQPQEFNWGMFWQAASAIATTAAVIVALWQTKYTNRKRVKLIYGEQFQYSSIVRKDYDIYRYTTIDIVNTGNRKIVVQQLGIELPDGFRYNLSDDIEFESSIYGFPIELEPEQFVKCIWSNDEFRDLLVTRHLHENDQRISFYIQDSAGIYYKKRILKTPKKFLEEN